MKTCPYCGAQVDDNAMVCNVCNASLAPAAPQNDPRPTMNGNPYNAQNAGPRPGAYGTPYQNGVPYPQPMAPADAPNTGFAVLGFFFPLIGLILFLMWKDQTPLKAKSAGKGALIGVIVWVGGSILVSIIGGISVAILSGM